jgi:hypothetical protein
MYIHAACFGFDVVLVVAVVGFCWPQVHRVKLIIFSSKILITSDLGKAPLVYVFIPMQTQFPPQHR